MNNYYVLIYLTKALKNKCEGKSFNFSLSPHKNVWEAYIGENENQHRLVFSSNPSETALFLDHYRAAKKSNVTAFFDDLAGQPITGVSLADNDRFITFRFENEMSLLFQIFGSKPNIFLIQDNLILESFKAPEEYKGNIPPEPRKASSAKKELNDNLSPKQAVTQTNPKFPRHLIPHIINHFKLNEKSVDEIGEITLRLTKSMETDAEFRVLVDGNLCLIPNKLLPVENKKVFDEINEAIRFVYYETSRERRLSAKVQSIKPKIDSSIRKAESAIGQLEQADKGIERAEQYEQFGHILMAHAHQKIDRNADTIMLPNLYDENKPIEISVKPSRSIAENAQNYYEKSAKAIRNVEESKRRLTETKQELKKLESLKKSLDDIEKVYEFDDWLKENENLLNELGILSVGSQQEKKPYRKLELDGYEIWLGKSAKSNDRLTTDAHKEDVWMHARGVSGSHLVIRMNNRKEMPPKFILLKAASLAAWNSKARGAGLVPVIITKRKYVTKPKGAPPGTVRVQKEEVEMVEPKKMVS
jgi:predicted ribosome quality control (RQC) complex YloA/Tae2 family protein